MVRVLTPLSLDKVPDQVRALINDRETARANRDFARSDSLRAEILALGYELSDLPAQAGKPTGVEIYLLGDKDKKPATNYLVLFGSGEIAPSSVDIYRSLLLTLNKRDLTLALITTPAGFQPNVESVYQEIKDFLLASLPDFNLTINLIFANTRVEANNPELVSQLDSADIIFTGPGSPTYAAKNLADTLLIKKIIERVKAGSSLILASAATISFSTHALPVYEIYKVGEDLRWLPGLDFYRSIWKPLTIIPHFNNNEGGSTLDTTHCYIGKNRAEILLSQLPTDAAVLGIDEHTALIIDLPTQKEQVRGKGTIHHLR